MTTHIDNDRDFDVDDPDVSRFDLVREGARRDGVEILHYEPRFPVPGTAAEKRVVRTIALLFTITGLAALAFLVAYIWWPWRFNGSNRLADWYTPILGGTLGLALFCIGAAVIVWGKKLLPAEVSVQERHDGRSPTDESRMTSATMLNMVDELGIQRRPLLKRAALLGLAPVGLVAAAPLIGGLIKSPHTPTDILFHTGFDPANNNGQPVPLVREDGTPVRPEEISAGGMLTVFPGIPGGTTNEYADSPTLLFHLRAADAEKLRANLKNVPLNKDNMWNNYVAYSKICTHAGCPASLYEQQTTRLLCPCHQSQFDITNNARPIFGPATRRLPMLPLTVNADGVFVAKSDYQVPIGPGFWERP
ncbi:MAG TPA: Rieske 2Fe-2S domain-containing protein [Micromonosporaceae bacterium]